MSQQLQLIEKPKTFKDRENNKLYYRNKGFSKQQLERTEKDNKLISHAQQVIADRSNGGGCNALDGGRAPPRKKIQKKIVSSSLRSDAPVILPPIQVSSKDNDDIEEAKTRILSIAETLKDDWDCDF